MNDIIEKIDKLFISYNYEIRSESNSQFRIYTLRYGMYFAAEILKLDPNFDVTRYKSNYSELGYATDVKTFEDILKLEEYLFEGFFIKTPLGSELRRRYERFVDRQVQHLPPKSTYNYIDCPYELIFENGHNDVNITSYSPIIGVESKHLVSAIDNYLNSINGPLLIIIEAPAGFGKTCTAYEILNIFSPNECNRLPFFTELSRNREARVFKHILLNEIDTQFPNGIKQNVVLQQIQEGRIPLIIDGFDELIAKDSSSEDVESMLSTIIELLRGNAKIIITSRKTALFKSDVFLDNIYDSTQNFALARFEIKEPQLETWLGADKLLIIDEAGFPLEQVANPVLLSYLRNISEEQLKAYIEDSNQDSTLINYYIEFLLNRERTRQNLKLNDDDQLSIFRKLSRIMSEYNITSESKDFIKDIIKDFSGSVLQSSLQRYSADEKPSFEELVDTLSNHVFLDRKEDDSIGFVNDFFLGYLIGESLILGKFQKYYPNSLGSIIPQDFALKSISAITLNSQSKKTALWEIYSSSQFNYLSEFYFDLDYYLNKGVLSKEYENLYISNRILKSITFDKESKLFNCNFNQVTFYDTHFHLGHFGKTSFYNCTFYNCAFTTASDLDYSDFALYACCSDNYFERDIHKFFDCQEEEVKDIDLTEREVLEQFFKVDGITPRARKFSYIRKAITNHSDREINQVIDVLISKKYLHFSDDVGYITREAIYQIKHDLI